LHDRVTQRALNEFRCINKNSYLLETLESQVRCLRCRVFFFWNAKNWPVKFSRNSGVNSAINPWILQLVDIIVLTAGYNSQGDLAETYCALHHRRSPIKCERRTWGLEIVWSLRFLPSEKTTVTCESQDLDRYTTWHHDH